MYKQLEDTEVLIVKAVKTYWNDLTEVQKAIKYSFNI